MVIHTSDLIMQSYWVLTRHRLGYFRNHDRLGGVGGGDLTPLQAVAG